MVLYHYSFQKFYFEIQHIAEAPDENNGISKRVRFRGFHGGKDRLSLGHLVPVLLSGKSNRESASFMTFVTPGICLLENVKLFVAAGQVYALAS
jgi:hypothetical protein